MSESHATRAELVLGWEEWLSLPELGLPAIRAKIDTGAKTSSLHAFAIEPFGPITRPLVRFGMHPVPGREDIVRTCTAPIADRREVTSSNGDKEVRFVIRTGLALGGVDRGEIELTLANRESMAYRMLLGRQALREGILVDPAASFLLPRLSHRLYSAGPRRSERPRSIRIALVATRPERPSNRMIQEEAEARAHKLDILPLDAVQLDFDRDTPRLLIGGEPAPAYDAVLSRATAGPAGLAAAIVRHLAQAGAVALNGADALERLRNPYRLATLLHAEGLPTRLAPAEQAVGRCLVIQGRVQASTGAIGEGMCRFAARIATALELGLVALDLAGSDHAPRLAGIDVNPALGGYGRQRRLARDVVMAVERRLGSPALLAHGDGDA